MDIQRERTTHSPRPFTELSPSNGGFPVVRPRDLPYDAYGKLRIGRRNGAGSHLSVGECRTAICSSLYWSLGGFKQSAATKVADWWATMVADC